MNDQCSAEPFEGLTLITLSKFFPDEKTAAKLCIEAGLVPSPDSEENLPSCPRCSSPSIVVKNRCSKFGFTYRCSRSRNRVKKRKRFSITGMICKAECNGMVSPSTNTWFENSNMSIVSGFYLIYLWIRGLSVTVAAEECGVSHNAAVKFYSCFREVAEITVSHLPLQIGGPKMHIEVDETFIRRRKCHSRATGRVMITMFGIVCRQTGEGIYWKVDSKNRRILWKHIEDCITPGSTVVSGAAPVNNGFDHELCSPGYLTVDNNQSGQGSENPFMNTCNTETRNHYVKETVKYLKNGKTLQKHMCEYSYRNKVLKKYKYCDGKFRQLLRDICKVYPGPGREGLKLKTIGVETTVNEPGFDIPLEEAIPSSSMEDVKC